MRDLINLMKEIFLLKQEDTSIVGLSAFKKKQRRVVTSRKKKTADKEVKLSDLMRRRSAAS